MVGIGIGIMRSLLGGVRFFFSVMDEWRLELEKVNDGKVGEPYHKEAFMRLLGFMRLLFHLIASVRGLLEP